ncbi:DUF3231 family protein [Calidifontibacillus oryziterrae]|uniref:DUF3231 family protein n=1 Tax=Calidifontibacillus oryziterrae TaxID=1191699 RepID=UPI0002FEF9B2|nr:DUF3231 family protein [Calidifontibacillus oryziterrae]
MYSLKPINITSTKTNSTEPLTSSEMGKLWATYMGNSKSKCILSYFLQHVEDEDIRTLLENAYNLSVDFIETIKGIFEKENFPIPKGFDEEDVNLSAPRLFQDEFYVHYIKYTAKAGASIYNVAFPLVYRNDVKEFYNYCIDSTKALMDQTKEILMNKGFIIKPPIIPVPEKVVFAHNDFLNGFFGHVRPMQALEIAHLYDNIENNVTSKALIMSFAQVAQNEKIRDLFKRGENLTHRNLERYMKKLSNENLPAPPYLDHLVTTSSFSPFSDKIMVSHKMDMFSMKIRAFGNSAAVTARHDLGLLYSRSLLNIQAFVEDAAEIYIENGWMEKPPHAADRDHIASDK